MPALRDYHILISHSWSYATKYDTVCSWFDEAQNFKWSDYSVCCDKPLDTSTDSELKEKLRNRIALSSCIVVLSGMYVTYSEWIDYEIETALAMDKPIIGVKPWGQERVPLKVQDSSSVMVGWNEKSVVDAVRNYAL
ncbi:MAG: TIR domain-containing protein [Bacteroides fragilis]|nr:TIR domain-containing protein [Bacteroides fragilis]